ncbi:MAG TPA: hypothetical protein VFC41_06550 [Anaerovoracaceae bacterium]|nr:hypothetical protein [Anaerovoracaceae bacterium]
MNKSIYLIILSLILLLSTSACSTIQSQQITDTRIPTVDEQTAPVITSSFTPTAKFTATPSATTRATSTHTPGLTTTPTFTPTLIPTYEILRGEVNVPHVSCFYGPHKSYLYKYGLVGGSNLEIIGRNIDTNYIEIRAIGGTNPCWMNLEWMNVKGDINNVRPVPPSEVILPQSPYYGPVSGVSAARDGDQVTISWNYLAISPGKDSLQFPYLIESWVCQDGNLRFLPVGSWQTSAIIIDQPGCNEPSHAHLYGVEKHGYTTPVEIPWPAAVK